jgi:thioesterase domain-containing protein
LDFTQEQHQSTATEYIRAIRTVQPHGPYFLIGQCHGAYIAFETVRQLEAAGEEIEFFGVLDTWPDENTRHKWRFLADYAWTRLWNLNGRTLGEVLARIGSKLLRRKADERQPVSRNESRFSMKALVESYWPGKDFQPPACFCPIVVFKVRKQFWYRKNDEKLGWGDRTRTGVKAERIPGDHITFMRQPHVRELAAMIARHLH